MAQAATVQELITYYVNLLIIQYSQSPKAQATISLFADVMLANAVALDVAQAYDVDTAVGVQLDVIGEYVGVDRFFSEIDLQDYFALVNYSQRLSLPASPPAFGASTYANFNNYSYNGTLEYGDIVTSQNALSDDNYRILIKLRIIQNNMNYSHEQIDAEIFALFGSTVRPESSGNMVMEYFISGSVTTLLQAVITKKLFPKPMGVRELVVSGITGDMFSLTNYAGFESPYGYGLSTYANYATLPGEVLTYSQISEV